jgi:hypothetical protein
MERFYCIYQAFRTSRSCQEFVEGRRPRKGEQLFPRLGDLLGRLHSMQIGNAEVLARSGGARHHICSEGGPKRRFKQP